LDIKETEKQNIGDSIHWTIAPYVTELETTDSKLTILSLTAIGKEQKLILLVMKTGLGIMCPANMEMLPMFEEEQR